MSDAYIDPPCPLPASARVVALDLDDCTVTLAFDSEEEVSRVIRGLKMGRRVRITETDPQASLRAAAGFKIK